MFDIERVFGYVLSAAIGGLGGALAYFMKIKGIEDSLKTKCNAEQVEEMIEKRLNFYIKSQEEELAWIKGCIKSIAKQVGAETPLE
jgi:hypothetical protein